MQIEDRLEATEDKLKDVFIRLRKVEKNISTAIDVFDKRV